MQIDEFYGVWTDLYADAKHEIFRLQLLDTYLVESEDKWFNAYKAGKPLPIPEDSNYFRTMERKKEEGVRRSQKSVAGGLPLSAYTRWVADMVYTRITEKRARRRWWWRGSGPGPNARKDRLLDVRQFRGNADDI